MFPQKSLLFNFLVPKYWNANRYWIFEMVHHINVRIIRTLKRMAKILVLEYFSTTTCSLKNPPFQRFMPKNAHFESFSSLKWINFGIRTEIEWSICNLADSPTGKNVHFESLFLMRTQSDHFTRISNHRCYKWSIWTDCFGSYSKIDSFYNRKGLKMGIFGQLHEGSHFGTKKLKWWAFEGTYGILKVLKTWVSSISILAIFLSVRMILTLIWWFDWNVLNMKNHCN